MEPAHVTRERHQKEREEAVPTRTVRRRFHVQMNLTVVDDQWRFDTIASITQNAPQGQLYTSVPAIQAAVASLGPLGDAFKTRSDAVAAYRAKLAIALDAEINARSDIDATLLTIKSLFENNAKSEDDLTAGGLQRRSPKASAGLLRPPESVDITFPKKLRGEFTASAHQTGLSRGNYAAQLSTDASMPTTWVDLKGMGKSRKVTGYKSGTQVWLRFARLSGQDQSDWGTPVLVTVP
jgi:hypothetical protein